MLQSSLTTIAARDQLPTRGNVRYLDYWTLDRGPSITQTCAIALNKVDCSHGAKLPSNSAAPLLHNWVQTLSLMATDSTLYQPLYAGLTRNVWISVLFKVLVGDIICKEDTLIDTKGNNPIWHINLYS